MNNVLLGNPVAADSSPFERLGKYGLLPVAAVPSAQVAIRLVDSLSAAGLPVIEVTLRTDAAILAIREITRTCPDALVGAGTVLNVEQASRAIDAGAHFVITPGLDPEIIQFCHDRGLQVVPGVCTPTEIHHAMRLGLRTLKFFPAEAMGGANTLLALYGPFPQVQFIPTGGIGLHNLRDYLKLPNILACGSSAWADLGDLATTDFDRIQRTATAARLIVDNER